MGSNLFQFKFQSEYELNRILKGGPWTFDNQLLMLTRWKAGMSANNVALEHASLWIQIWGVPFDMMSPEVASEVGNKIGVVEDVERRWKTDDNNSNVADTMPLLSPKGAGHQFLNDEANGKFSIITSSLGQGDAKPNKPKSTWTRLNRMDVGPLVSTNFKMESRTGKRGLEEVLNTDRNRDAKPKYYKRSKGDKEDGNAENTSAGVADHHCREQ